MAEAAVQISFFEKRDNLQYELVRADFQKGAYVPTGRFYRKLDSIEDNSTADLSMLDPEDFQFYRMRRTNPGTYEGPDDGGGTPVAMAA